MAWDDGLSILAVVPVSAFVVAMIAVLANIHPVKSEYIIIAASAESTEIQVYVLARGGKFIGDDVGGAEDTLRDARSG